MAILIGLLLFALPFLGYALWWRLSGQQGGATVPLAALGIGAAGVLLALGLAIHWGLSRGIERGEAYVPARIEGGSIRH